MNIFKILSSYSGRINEPNISAFLSYLINPNEDHGMGSWLLLRMLEESDSFNIIDENMDEFRSKLESNFYSVLIRPEFAVEPDGSVKERRYIDILVEIYQLDNPVPVYSIAIENKIYETSIADKDQLRDEVNGLKQLYGDSDSTRIGLIYLIPKETSNAQRAFQTADCGHKKIILWKGPDSSISSRLKEILLLESQGEIDPIFEAMKNIIRSFRSFIENDFKSQYEYKSEKIQKQDYGKTVIEHITEIYNSYEYNRDYNVKEFKNQLSAKVMTESGKILDPSTRNCQTYQVIVNDMNRTNYSVKNPEEMRFNLFYYPDENDRAIIRKFSIDSCPENIQIYYKSGGERTSISVKDLKVLNK